LCELVGQNVDAFANAVLHDVLPLVSISKVNDGPAFKPCSLFAESNTCGKNDQIVGVHQLVVQILTTCYLHAGGSATNGVECSPNTACGNF
jgi:hypothetical protein